jgi:colanic acid/amylovoran biosynthesis glycosyltransferase
VIESLATGVPVVTTAVGGIPDMVVNEETGLLVPPRDPAAIVEAVSKLRTSPELRAKLIDQGRRHVEANFDAHKNTAQMMSYIKELIDSRVRSARSGTPTPPSAQSSASARE